MVDPNTNLKRAVAYDKLLNNAFHFDAFHYNIIPKLMGSPPIMGGIVVKYYYFIIY